MRRLGGREGRGEGGEVQGCNKTFLQEVGGGKSTLPV